MKNTTFLLFGLILFSNLCYSQNGRMDVNSISAKITPSGVMFNDYTGIKPGFEVLKDSGTSTIYTSSLNFAGIIRGDSLLSGIFDMFGNDTNVRLSPGPLSVTPGTSTDSAKRDFGPANITSSVVAKWNKVFCVSRLDIEAFKQWYACSQDPSCNTAIHYPGYSIPKSIVDWPAHGDISQSQDYYLAPFYDRNSDGDYNPNDGDFPCIKGDKYCWYILNDKWKPNNPIGIEIHVEVYAFNKDITNPIDRTLFVGYDIINRSTFTLDSFKVSQFVDIEIGCGLDDYVGAFPSLNSIFGYNADAVDDNCLSGVIPFGTNPPAQGITVLNRALTGAMFFTNSPGNMGSPSNLMEYYHYMSNKWKDGTPLHYGGNGYPAPVGTSTSGVQTNFVFPDTPPSGMSVWTESSAGNPSGDRRMVANTGGVTLTPGETYELDLAYIFSRANTGGSLASVAKLKVEIPLVQAFYNDSITPCSDSLTGTLSQKELFKDVVSVYPNPFHNSFEINLKGAQGEVTIILIDAFGKQILRETSNFSSKTITLDGLAKGIYFLKIYNQKQEYYIEKLIKL